MFDNVNGFVPNSHLNGQESADSTEPSAHYSPLTGLTGGPLAGEPADEPATEPAPDGEALQDVVAPTIDAASAVQSDEEMPAVAEEPSVEAEISSEPMTQGVEPDAAVGEAVASSDLAGENSLETEPTVIEPDVTLQALSTNPEASIEDEGEASVDAESPVEGVAEGSTDGEAPIEEISEAALALEVSGETGVEADVPAEPDPTQPLPVGRPPSPLGLDAQIESLLFVADGPAPVAKLAEALEVKVGEVEAALAVLDERYLGRGIAIQRIKDRVQLTTSATAAPIIQRFLGLSATAPLSKAALETLAIIAYRQPITRPQIEQVRGVNSDSVIKNLLTKGLVEEAGIAEGPGRPVLYITTPEFLQHFGLSNLAELPELNLDDVRRSFASEILKG